MRVRLSVGVAQNLAPGAAARLGFDSEKLREEFPRLITVDISGYGQSGPKRDYKAYDLLARDPSSSGSSGRCNSSSSLTVSFSQTFTQAGASVQTWMASQTACGARVVMRRHRQRLKVAGWEENADAPSKMPWTPFAPSASLRRL